MSVLFTLLFFASLVLMIIGLVKPKIFARKKDMPPKRVKTSLLFGGLSILCLMLIGATTPKKENSEHKKESSTTDSKQEIYSKQEISAIEVNARSLYRAYQANEVSADEKFKDKRIKISGIIDSINKDMFDEVWLELATGDLFSSIRAKLDEQYITRAAKLKRGQKIILQCVGDGMIIETPILRECSIM